jgi:tRNA (mo5U34)-methyltransferase
MDTSAGGLQLIPEAPPEVDLDAVFRQIPTWHQRWEVFRGVFTPGRNPVEALLEGVGLPVDLRGKRVLDVGAFNGCFSFECERRGADEVVALDLQDPSGLGFFALRDLLGSRRVRFEQGSVYNLDSASLGQFDIVLFLGVLYHLRYPLLAFDQLRKITAGTLYVETLVIDDRFLHGGKDFQPLRDYHAALTEVALWQFYKGAELAGDSSNWFGPNIRAVLDGLESAGFQPRLHSTWGDRAGFQASAGANGTLQTSYEGQSQIVRRGLNL